VDVDVDRVQCFDKTGTLTKEGVDFLAQEEYDEEEDWWASYRTPREIPLDRMPAYLELLRRTRATPGAAGSSFRSAGQQNGYADYQHNYTSLAAFSIPDARVTFLLVVSGERMGCADGGDPEEVEAQLVLYSTEPGKHVSPKLAPIFQISVVGGLTCSFGTFRARSDLSTNHVPSLHSRLAVSLCAQEMLFLLTAAALFHGKQELRSMNPETGSYFHQRPITSEDCNPNDHWGVLDDDGLVQFRPFLDATLAPVAFDQSWILDERPGLDEVEAARRQKYAPDLRPLNELKAPLEAFRLATAKAKAKAK